MDKQQELGGAQALLELGSKVKGDNNDESDKIKDSKVDESLNDNENQESNEHTTDHDEFDAKATNQQINDAVEAAVMKYVGGNLDEDSPRKKRKANDDFSNLGDFQNWNFLEEEEEDQRKKKRSNNHEIDPELSNLSEHDPLRAAILETREFAKNLGAPYTASQIQQVINSLHNQQPTPGSSSNQTFQQLQANEISNLQKKFQKNSNEPINNEFPNGFQHITSIEQLADEAAKITMNWYKTVPETKGPRPFSKEESQAIEFFINGYGYLFRMDRKEVCNRIWTPERKKDNFWEYLTKVVPYRSRASTYKHVRRQYHPFDVRGKWTQEEDEKLRQLSLTKQSNWKEIGGIMGRMPEDCRDRWRNYLKCGMNRVENKWSAEEENKLKQVVTDMLTKQKATAINWTLVSEAMEGTRSRIQCRYKWNKLVKRESVNRSSFMDDNTKLWLFETMKKLNYEALNEVDWNLISKLYDDEFKIQPSNWLPTDFQFGFDKFKTIVKDYKRITMPELLEKLTNEILSRQRRDKNPDDNNDREYLWRQ